MANRFAGKIKSGEIPSPDALKSEFKAMAKELHPDIAGPDSHLAFVRVREEYEAALARFDSLRFGIGARGASGTGAVGDPWPELGLLLKRGFPKRPRHEKEIIRYEYAKWRFREAIRRLGDNMGEWFDVFEADVLSLADAGMKTSILSLLGDLVEYRRKKLPALRTAMEMEFEAIRASRALEGPADMFLSKLVSELGDGRDIR